MGIGLAHVGEFAFVLVLLGMEAGVVSQPDYQRVISIAVGSLILTPPLMKAGLRIVHQEQAAERADDDRDPGGQLGNLATVIGAGPTGRQLASQLEILGKDVCLIDLSPINLHPYAMEGFRTVAGDGTQRRILEYAGVGESVMIAVCVPDDEAALRIVRSIRKCNPAGVVIVRCRFLANAKKLLAAGADRVVSEEAEASLALLRIVEKFENQMLENQSRRVQSG
jgi:CPA2 family monovalent cation:H+ antiporter-2